MRSCAERRRPSRTSDRALDGDAGAGRQPVGLAVLQRGRYTQWLRIRVSMAQRVSYRRSAEEAGVGLMAWCRGALEAAASRGLGPALQERPPTGGYTGQVEITLTRSQEDACRTAANRIGQDLAEWMREDLDSAADTNVPRLAEISRVVREAWR